MQSRRSNRSWGTSFRRPDLSFTVRLRYTLELLCDEARILVIVVALGFTNKLSHVLQLCRPAPELNKKNKSKKLEKTRQRIENLYLCLFFSYCLWAFLFCSWPTRSQLMSTCGYTRTGYTYSKVTLIITEAALPELPPGKVASRKKSCGVSICKFPREATRQLGKVEAISGILSGFPRTISELSGMGDLQRDSRESIRANHSLLKPLFL